MVYDEHIDSRRRQASPASPAEPRQTFSFCWRLDARCRLFKVGSAQASHLVMQHAKPVPTAGSISLGTLSTPPTHTHTHTVVLQSSALCAQVDLITIIRLCGICCWGATQGALGGQSADDTRSHWMRHWVMYYTSMCVSLFVCWSKILASAIIPQLPHTGAGGRGVPRMPFT